MAHRPRLSNKAFQLEKLPIFAQKKMQMEQTILQLSRNMQAKERAQGAELAKINEEIAKGKEQLANLKLFASPASMNLVANLFPNQRYGVVLWSSLSRGLLFRAKTFIDTFGWQAVRCV